MLHPNESEKDLSDWSMKDLANYLSFFFEQNFVGISVDFNENRLFVSHHMAGFYLFITEDSGRWRFRNPCVSDILYNKADVFNAILHISTSYAVYAAKYHKLQYFECLA